MHNNKRLPLICALLASFASTAAQAEIKLYDDNQTTFSTDGYINAFYVNNDVDRPGDQFDRRQSRVKMGFLPNWIGFNVSRQAGDLKLGARSSFWVTINDSETNGTETGIDVRQFYGTIDGGWGQVLIGKDFGLFARSNILRDELLSGFGQASDTLGLMDGGGVSFGNIGTGYPYPFPSAQITYRSPQQHALKVAVGVLDPYDSNDVGGTGKAYQSAPRFETEVSYQTSLGATELYAWINGAYQTSENTDSTIEDVTSRGLGYGVQAKLGGTSITASGFDAEGMHPLFSNNLGQANLREIDSKGYLLQFGQQIDKFRLALSYGRSEDDGNLLGGEADYENKAVLLSYAVNDSLKLLGNFSRFEIDDKQAGEIESTDTLAVGAALSW
ncbi:hypothetical protein A6D6_01786 [Alcanivorax xiamenensis]|uniref:Porin n=1 Tax=Alcanivorax xiamenensis TaxID=1177156 RepID=A0ABQ6Y9F9_9GAMM|nr:MULTISPECIES: porin [Alcanivorax]KAF0806206.1 hypothetical protein A6D6_01786 [Alcanivorax xiamenensis]